MHTQADLKYITPGAGYPPIVCDRGEGASPGAVAMVAGAAGAAAGAGIAIAKNLGKSEQDKSSEDK